MLTELVYLIFFFQDLLAVSVSYHIENETVILPCEQLSKNSIIWYGPPNLVIYAIGKNIYLNLPKSDRFVIVHTNGTNQYNLKIRYFSIDDRGIYKCVRRDPKEKVQEMYFNLEMTKAPRNLTIKNESYNNTVYGYLNKTLSLTCNVIEGSPKGKLVWITNNETVKEAAVSSLVFYFLPTQKDHLKLFTCATRSNNTGHILQHTVRLFVYMPPMVSISSNKTIGIPESEDLALYCNYSSNHVVNELKWEKMFAQKSQLVGRSMFLNITSIKRHNAGSYKCTVTNMAGTASDIVTIEVYYSPTIHVTFEDHGSYKQLNCLAHGVPNLYIYNQWEHKSEYSDLIRYLPDNGSGKLILPSIPGETDRHHDRGLYICQASNKVSLNGSSYFIPGEFFLKAQGKPYFVTSNYNTQYGIKGQQVNLTYDFVSFPGIENISIIVNEMKRSNENYFLKIMKVIDRVYHKTVSVNGSRLMLSVSIKAERDFGLYKLKLYNQFGSAAFTIDLRPLRAPQDIKAVTLDTQIIVKWTGNHYIGLQETFIVEYRKHFESQWSRVSAEDKSTAIIDGLQPGAVYFLRVYSKNAAGESSKSDIIIVKTEKHHSKVTIFTLELAMILGVMVLMMVICWCGIKALKNKQRSCRNQDSRGTLACRNDESGSRPAHYDEIDSVYYNPINSTVYRQATRNNAHNCSRQALNDHLEDSEPNNMSSRNVHCAIHQFKHSHENNALRSSSDESYLVPCRNYIDLDNNRITKNEQQDASIEETEKNVKESSISSNNSETNIKIIRRYESLNVSDINDHSYKKCNEIDASPMLKMDA